MEPVFLIAAIIYLVSCACYFAYLFFQKDRVQRWAVGLVGSAFALHTATLVAAGIHHRNRPFPIAALAVADDRGRRR